MRRVADVIEAGMIEALGPDVDGRFKIGAPVIAWTRRSYAELAVAPTWAVRPMPEALDFEQAAAIPVVFDDSSARRNAATPLFCGVVM